VPEIGHRIVRIKVDVIVTTGTPVTPLWKERPRPFARLYDLRTIRSVGNRGEPVAPGATSPDCANSRLGSCWQAARALQRRIPDMRRLALRRMLAMPPRVRDESVFGGARTPALKCAIPQFAARRHQPALECEGPPAGRTCHYVQADHCENTTNRVRISNLEGRGFPLGGIRSMERAGGLMSYCGQTYRTFRMREYVTKSYAVQAGDYR